MKIVLVVCIMLWIVNIIIAISYAYIAMFRDINIQDIVGIVFTFISVIVLTIASILIIKEMCE